MNLLNKLTGWKTPEFWLTVVAQVIAVLVLFGVIRSDDVAALQDSVVEIVKALAVFVVQITTLIAYFRNRAEVQARVIELAKRYDSPEVDYRGVDTLRVLESKLDRVLEEILGLQDRNVEPEIPLTQCEKGLPIDECCKPKPWPRSNLSNQGS